MARLSFAWQMAKRRWSSDSSLCPYCDSRFADRLQRKWVLIEARRCMYCGLIFRWPTDPAEANREFYESNYDGQQATDVPDAVAARKIASDGFRGTPWYRGHRVKFVEQVLGSPGSRTLLDFGCSWGYTTRQYQAAGWTTYGFEIDRRRAEFGREALGLDIKSDLAEYRGRQLDVIIADHSLEHVPRIGVTLNSLLGLAAANAVLIVFVPNGACRDARRLGVGWGPFIGETHTAAFTIDWFKRNLRRHGFHAEFRNPDGAPQRDGEYLDDGSEICMVARAILPGATGA